MTIFVDASAMVSVYDPKDPNHNQAQSLTEHFLNNQVITSNFVFAEIVTILSQRVGKGDAILVGNYIKQNFTIMKLASETEDLAWEIFKKQKSKNVSFVDCTTFALFKKGVFDTAFTFDSDFKSNEIPTLN